MSTLSIKQNIWKAAHKKLEGVVADFETRVAELKTEAVEVELSESASQSDGRRASEFELLDSLTSQLEFAKNELNVLDTLHPEKIHEVVEHGAVVITDKRKLFVSTGVEEFTADGEAYFGLSKEAPLYKNMAGCKAGDKVSFNGIESFLGCNTSFRRV